MIDWNLARKYRTNRNRAVNEMNRLNKLPIQIAGTLRGLNYDDMSLTEKRIADLLGREGYLFFDAEGNCKEMVSLT